MAKPERRLGPLAAVALLHLLALALLLKAGVWRDRGRPLAPRPPLEVTLLLPPPVALPAPQAAPPRAPPPAAAPPRPQRPVPAPLEVLQVPAAAALPADATPTAPAAPAAPAEVAASAPVPLRLALPRASTRRSPALDDPRANRVRPTLEAQIAAALGGEDAWTEEHLEEGVVRFRRGKACVEVHETRDATLDPFNQSVFHKPRLARSC